MKNPRLAWAVVALLGLVLVACNAKLNAWQAGIPGWKTPMRVAYATPRDGYLEAVLEMTGLTLVTYVPNDPECAAIFSADSPVDYVNANPGGEFRAGDRSCRAVGIGTLKVWRNRQPRPPNRGGAIIARAQADYRKIYEDADVVFLRGRFPLSGKVGWVGLDDLIAVVPKVPACEMPIARNTSSMEYYPVGRHVLTLVSTRGQCPIQGLITPYGKPAPEQAESS